MFSGKPPFLSQKQSSRREAGLIQDFGDGLSAPGFSGLGLLRIPPSGLA
jgi:hypothetical protein